MRERTKTTEKNVKDFFAKLIEIINLSQKFSINIEIEENKKSIEILNQQLIAENINPENLEKIFIDARKIALDLQINLSKQMISNLTPEESMIKKQAKPDSRIHEILALSLEAIEKILKAENLSPKKSQLFRTLITFHKNLEEGEGLRLYPLDTFENLINQYFQIVEPAHGLKKNKVLEKAENTGSVKISLKPRNAVNEFEEVKGLSENNQADSSVSKAIDEDLSDLLKNLKVITNQYINLQKEIRIFLKPLSEFKAQNQIYNQIRVINSVEPKDQSQYDAIVSGFERAIAPLKMKKIKQPLKPESPIARKYTQLSQQAEAVEKERTSKVSQLLNTDDHSLTKQEAEKILIQKQIQFTEEAVSQLKEISNNLTKVNEERFAKIGSTIDPLKRKISALKLNISNLKANKAYSSIKKITSLEKSLKNITLIFDHNIELFSQNILQENIATSDMKLGLEVIEGEVESSLQTVNNFFRDKVVDLHYTLVTLKDQTTNSVGVSNKAHSVVASLQKRLEDLNSPEAYDCPNYFDLDADKIINLESDIQKAIVINQLNYHLVALKQQRNSYDIEKTKSLMDLESIQSKLDSLYEHLSSAPLNLSDIQTLREDILEAKLQAEKLESREMKIVFNLLNKIEEEIKILVDVNEEDLRIDILQNMHTKINENKNNYLNSIINEVQFKATLVSDLGTEISDENLKELTYKAPDILVLGNFGRFLLELLDAIAELFEDHQAPRPQFFTKQTEIKVTDAIINARKELGLINKVITENMDNPTNSPQSKN
ncbi:MAG: hypothetical protein H0U57_10125 [Tatlockia sp.]|nr:hypothetical protein [Tatlockia sp.]